MHERPLWQEAVSFAARAHAHQLRKDGRTPYIAHVVRVALIVRDLFGCDDPGAIAAALLHDTIEDTGADYDQIHGRFGPDVADLVAALTKNAALPEAQREAEYDRRLAAADWRARLIKLADTYDNLCDLGASDRPDRAARLARAAEKCRRAIALAEPDAALHAQTRRGIDLLRGRMAAEAEDPGAGCA